MRRVLLGVLVLVLAGCGDRPGTSGTGRGEVDGFLRKDRFQGEWYFRQTVLEVPAKASLVHEGWATRLERVRFEIQEKALIAYRRAGGPDLEPVAAWAIEEHRALDRGVDRPWWERDLIRVDWSRDLVEVSPPYVAFPGEIVTATGTAGWALAAGGEDPDRPEIEDRSIGIVGLYRLVPDPVPCARIAEVTYPAGDASACEPVVVKQRTSFLGIDPSVPVMERLPYPDRAPLAADLDGDGVIGAGETIEKVLQLCVSFSGDGRCETDSEGEPREVTVECTAAMLQALAADPWYGKLGLDASDCEPEEVPLADRFGFRRVEGGTVPLIARWNIWKQAQREPRPIVLFTTPGFPAEKLPAVQAAARSWSEALVETVAAMGAETPAGLQMVEVRENACTPANVRAFVSRDKALAERVTRVAGSLQGIDGTNLVEVCSALEAHSTFRWQKPGDLRFSTITWSTDASEETPIALSSVAADPLTGEIVNAAIVLNGPAVERQGALGADVVQALRGDPDAPEVLPRRSVSPRPGEPLPGGGGGLEPEGWEQARLDRLATDPSLEAMLVDADALWIAGAHPHQEVTERHVARASPRALAHREAARADIARRLGEEDCVFPSSSTQSAVIEMAARLGRSEAPREEVADDIEARLVSGLALHALGHALGLGHNLAGSHDALNYDDRFWKIRSSHLASISATLENGLAVGEEKAALERCLEDARARDVEPPTTFECLHLDEHATSSVMDLLARFDAREAGVGKYDRAALRFGYGQLLDVFEEELGLSEHLVASSLFYLNYRKIPDWMGGVDSISRRLRVSQPARNRERMRWIRATSAGSLPVIGEDGRCTARCPEPEGAPVAVPYAFCGDRAADGDDITCARWDAGADAEEVADHAILRGQLVGAFLASRLGDRSWDPQVYLDDQRERTLTPLVRQVRAYWRYGSRIERYDIGVSLANAMAKTVNALFSYLVPVEGGWYCLSGDAFRPCPSGSGGPALELPPARGYWNRLGEWTLEGVGTSQDVREVLRVLTRPLHSGGAGLYRWFGGSILEIVGDLIAGDAVDAGIVVRREGELVLVHAPRAEDEVMAPLRSRVGEDWALGSQAALLAFTSLSVPGDGVLDASEYLFVTLKGAEDDGPYPGIDRQDRAQYVEFTDPTTNTTYVAVNTADGRSVTHRLLSAANDHVERSWRPAKERLAAATPGTAEYNEAHQWLRHAEGTLRQKVDRLDFIRALRRLYVP